MTDRHEGSPCNMHEALVSYLYSEATPDEALKVENHVKQCARCAEELAAFEGVRTMLQQWQVGDVPVMGVRPEAVRRSLRAVLKEIFVVAPIWAKVAVAATAALLVFAIMGTEVSVGPGGFTFRANLLRRPGAAAAAPTPTSEVARVNPEPAASLTRDQVEQIVNRQILEAEKQQKQELTVELAAMESQVSRTRSADVAKLAMKLEEQRNHIRTIESDIDRREGLDVADILFSSGGSSGAPEGGR